MITFENWLENNEDYFDDEEYNNAFADAERAYGKLDYAKSSPDPTGTNRKKCYANYLAAKEKSPPLCPLTAVL